ncbi:MAG: polysaccharide biosynthesis tyrosine autokinase [Candidatus Omnitrophota bacterium]
MENDVMPVVTLRDYLRVLFRQKAVVVVVFATVVLVVVLGLQFKTPVYQAEVKILISAEKQVSAPYYRELSAYANSQVVLTQSEIVRSGPVIERVVGALGLNKRPMDYEKRFCSPLKKAWVNFNVKRLDKKYSSLSEEQRKTYLFRYAAEDLKEHIDVRPLRDTNLFVISVRDFSPVGAAIIANVVSRSYAIFDLEQQLAEMELKYGEKHLMVKQLRDSIDKMREGLNGHPLSNIEAIGPASVKIIEQARVPLRPQGLPKMVIFILALLFAPFLGVVLAFCFDYLDQSFRSVEDVEMRLGLPLLGSIPLKGKFKREFLGRMADQLHILLEDKHCRSLALSSVLPREGTTTIVANLARNFSRKRRQRVLLIDANFRNPGLHCAFDRDISLGLSDVIEGEASYDQAIKNIEPNLSLLTAGKTMLNPLILLSSSRMSELFNYAQKKYTVIFIDCPNFKDFSDLVAICGFVDAAAIIISEGKVRRQVARRAVEALKKEKANILGVILNQRRFAIPQSLYQAV